MERTSELEDAPHLILYFDVNKTMILQDPSQGKDLHHVLNDLLAEDALGVVTNHEGELRWEIAGEKSSETASLATYGSFLREKYPMHPDPTTSKANKHVRREERRHFTSPGHAGASLSSKHTALLAQLRHDTSDSFYYILPSFFRLIQFLTDHSIHYNLIFRTFGNDLHAIAEEFNLFCSNQHPHFHPSSDPNIRIDGSMEKFPDKRLHLTNKVSRHFGTFLRTKEEIVLVLGTFKQPPTILSDTSVEEFYGNDLDDLQVVRGIGHIHHLLTTQWRQEEATLAFRDFYPYWFHQEEVAEAGKVLPVDMINHKEQDVMSFFFDDNILDDDPHIVDVRTLQDESVPFKDTKDKLLVRVEPLAAIENTNYYIDRLEQAKRRRQ